MSSKTLKNSPNTSRTLLVAVIALISALLMPSMVACSESQPGAMNDTSPEEISINKESDPIDALPYEDKTGSGKADMNSAADAANTSNVTDTTDTSSELASLKNTVSKLVSPYGDKVAIAVRMLDGSGGFSIKGDESFVSASMIKLLILAELLDEVNTQAISLDGAYSLKSSDIVGGTGNLQGKAPGTTYTYYDLAKRMIADSDNTATNIIIDKIGISSINSRASKLGLLKTSLNRKMMDLNSGLENYISANDAAEILWRIANRSLVSEDLCEKAESYLLAQTDTLGLAEGIAGSVPFGHKTGSLNSIRHDGGIVYLDKNPYVIVVLTDIGSAEANKLMREISSTVIKALES